MLDNESCVSHDWVTYAGDNRMAIAADLIAYLLPNGTNPDRKRSDWDSCPDWPPDVFAVAASILEVTGGYAAPSINDGGEGPGIFDDQWRRRIKRSAVKWQSLWTAPPSVQKLWKRLVAQYRRADIDDAHLPLARCALELLAIADEACEGIGFAITKLGWFYTPSRIRGSAPNRSPKKLSEVHARRLVFARAVMEQTQRYYGRRTARSWLPIPHSLCWAVPPARACVQPKTNTPGVGYTLRALSHNLALLPAKTAVCTSWLFGHPSDETAKPLNLLLIPYPFVVSGNAFRAAKTDVDGGYGFFEVVPTWLKAVKPVEFVRFIKTLVDEARRESGDIHGVVLPEGALPTDFAMEVAFELPRRVKGLELFVTGATEIKHGRNSKSAGQNSALTVRYVNDRPYQGWTQSKHHRWRLDSGQIRRYHLGHTLDPHLDWWERIGVSSRECVFSVVRRGASLAVLICEDLARLDPVLPIINSVGPSLVVVLLMDGPQLERRWPGRHASVLADDPGSSVLTLTSLGMIARSTMPGEAMSRTISLWKQAGDVAKELQMPAGCHGLVLSLASSVAEQTTLDGRQDGGTTPKFTLGACRPVRLKSLPRWIDAPS
ncbi:MAG: hypothetical protein IPK81_05165 [Rhodospirillales bacterium]|nr:MAG: hypothetical protein IPK81_05165 [Rhodospirillales bacterium]